MAGLQRVVGAHWIACIRARVLKPPSLFDQQDEMGERERKGETGTGVLVEPFVLGSSPLSKLIMFV